ncbi:MAG: hypothetical protein H7256_14830 [Bdellovibrio sp.]|nr:hypothetical protein [Bdellovibrio sp.]
MVPLHFLKKENKPVYIILQKDTFLFIDDILKGTDFTMLTPGRGSGYIECHLLMKDAKRSLLPVFSEAISNSRDDQKYINATTQIKEFADFLRVPLKLDMSVDA